MTNLRDSQSEYESVKDTFVSLDESVDKLKKLKKNRIEFADDESDIDTLKRISLEYDIMILENKFLLSTDFTALIKVYFDKFEIEVRNIRDAIFHNEMCRKEIMENIQRFKLQLNTIEKYCQSSIVQRNILEYQTQ